jgi:hypothetical protein
MALKCTFVMNHRAGHQSSESRRRYESPSQPWFAVDKGDADEGKGCLVWDAGVERHWKVLLK